MNPRKRPSTEQTGIGKKWRRRKRSVGPRYAHAHTLSCAETSGQKPLHNAYAIFVCVRLLTECVQEEREQEPEPEQEQELLLEKEEREMKLNMTHPAGTLRCHERLVHSI